MRKVSSKEKRSAFDNSLDIQFFKQLTKAPWKVQRYNGKKNKTKFSIKPLKRDKAGKFIN